MRQTEHIFRQHFLPLYPRLFAIAAAILGEGGDEAADAVQEAMVKIWNMGDRMADVDNPARYAATVTRRSAIDILRHRCETRDEECAAGIEDDPLPDPDTHAFLDRMIATLPQSQRLVMRLSVCDGLAADEIAQATGLTSVNVRQLLSRGRKKLRILYSKYMNP